MGARLAESDNLAFLEDALDDITTEEHVLNEQLRAIDARGSLRLDADTVGDQLHELADVARARMANPSLELMAELFDLLGIDLVRVCADRFEGTAGYPIEVLEWFAMEFVEELRNGQKGVYARLGDRWGVKWPTARSWVMAAVRRGTLIWTGGDHAPNGHLRGEEPGDPPPGSFEQRLGLLQEWVEEHGTSHVPRRTVYQGAKLRGWIDAQRQRYRKGTLTRDQIDVLEAIPGWRSRSESKG